MAKVTKCTIIITNAGIDFKWNQMGPIPHSSTLSGLDAIYPFLLKKEVYQRSSLRRCYTGQLATTIFRATPYRGKSIPVFSAQHWVWQRVASFWTSFKNTIRCCHENTIRCCHENTIRCCHENTIRCCAENRWCKSTRVTPPKKPAQIK